MHNTRGHSLIIGIRGGWVYKNNRMPFNNNVQRKCIRCKKLPTKDGHDACIANLPDVEFACCGHGNIWSAYIKFNSGKVIREKEAIKKMKELKNV